MKSFRRALCFALCFAVLLCITTVSAYAANFTDEETIVNGKAANILTDLGIMQSEEDGSFDPTGTVTRAELCRIICVALNGGKAPELGTVVSSYPDAADHWAAGYIEYCSNLGVVAGRGDGNFDPDGAVTGTEASKMLLIMIGYDAENEEFVGAHWAINVVVRANQKNFYEGLEDLDPSAALTRDQAAQLVYNAVGAVMVEYEYKLMKDGNDELQAVPFLKEKDDGRTILSQKFNVIP